MTAPQLSAEPAPSPETPGQIVAFPQVGAPPGGGPASESKIQPLDFRQPALLSNSQLRRLQMRHDEFARSLGVRLSMHFRLEFAVQVASLTTLAFRKLVEAIPNPAHVTVFNLKSLTGLGLLQLPRDFAFSIVDRLLGGSGKAQSLPRDLSEIEVAVLDQGLLIILREWAQHVAQLNENEPSIVGHESNTRFLQTSASDTNMLALSLSLSMGDNASTAVLAVPYPMIEPLLDKLEPPRPQSQPAAKPPIAAACKWNSQLDEVPVWLSAHWTGLQITARELMNLKAGDLLPVDSRCLEQVEVRMANVPKFTARLGTRGAAWALELLSPLKT